MQCKKSWWHWRGFIEMLIAIMPGFIIASINHDIIFLFISFMSACAIMPAGNSYNHITSVIIHLATIFIISYTLMLLLLHNVPLACALMIIIGLVMGYIEHGNPLMRSANSFVFIGIIYPAFHLSTVNIGIAQYFFMFICSLISILCALIVFPIKRIHWRYHQQYCVADLVYYCKYAVPITITILLWQALQIQEPQWLIWSSLSVLILNLEDAKQKTHDRLRGAILGVSCGLLLSSILHSAMTDDSALLGCYSMVALISLRAITKYFIAFSTRCAMAVLFTQSGSNLAMGEYRLLNIFIGGIIGIAVAFSYSIYYSARKQLPANHH
jgi:hypothetical protein